MYSAVPLEKLMIIPPAYGLKSTLRQSMSSCTPFCTANSNKKFVTQSWYNSSLLIFHKSFFGLNQNI
jgi:predicted aconitase